MALLNDNTADITVGIIWKYDLKRLRVRIGRDKHLAAVGSSVISDCVLTG